MHRQWLFSSSAHKKQDQENQSDICAARAAHKKEDEFSFCITSRPSTIIPPSSTSLISIFLGSLFKHEQKSDLIMAAVVDRDGGGGGGRIQFPEEK
jgi:hypothetical protein